MRPARHLFVLGFVLGTACGPGGGHTGAAPPAKSTLVSPAGDGGVSPNSQDTLSQSNRPFAMLGGGPTHRHRSALPGPRTVPVEVARFETGARIPASPVIGPDGTVYIGSLDGTFNALRQDGKLRWGYVCDEPVFGTAAVSQLGMIYVGCDDDKLLAFSTDGTLRFTYPMAEDVDSSPVVGPDGSIYVGGDALHIVSVQGKRRMKVWLGGHVSTSPAVRPDGLVIAGSHDHRLYAVQPSGEVSWSFDTRGALLGPALVLDTNDVIFGSEDGYIYHLSALGELRWSFKTGGPVRSGAALSQDGQVIYTASSDGAVYALAVSTGKQIWRTETRGAVMATPMADSEGRLYIGSRDQNLYALEAASGAVIWRVSLGAEMDATVAIAADRRLIVASDDGSIRILEERRWDHL